MSDLKHKTPQELRSLIRWCESNRETIETQRLLKQEMIERLNKEVLELGRSLHNIGQKEVRARMYLARKDTGQE